MISLPTGWRINRTFTLRPASPRYINVSDRGMGYCIGIARVTDCQERVTVTNCSQLSWVVIFTSRAGSEGEEA